MRPPVSKCLPVEALTMSWLSVRRIYMATEDGPGGIYEALHHFRFV